MDQAYPDFPLNEYRAEGDYFDNDALLGRTREFATSTGAKVVARLVRNGRGSALAARDHLQFTDYGELKEVTIGGAGTPFAGVVPDGLAEVPDNAVFWSLIKGPVQVESTGAAQIPQGTKLATGAAGQVVTWTNQETEAIVGFSNENAGATAGYAFEAIINAIYG